jgi:hypothetical protein
MKKTISIKLVFIIWLIFEATTFLLARNGAIGELYRDPYNYSIDWWLTAALTGGIPVVIGVLYVIIWVWIIKPIKNLKK